MVVSVPPGDLSEYVQITSDTSADAISDNPIVMNLVGLTITNNLTTYLALTKQDPLPVNVFNVNVTKTMMASYFNSDSTFNAGTFLTNMEVNVLPVDVIGSAPYDGKRSFATGCIGVSTSNEYANLNLIEAVIKYISKKEINSDLAYLVMAPGSLQAVSNQMATFGTDAVTNCAANTAVSYSICRLLYDLTGGTGVRPMTNSTTVLADTFVVGDKFLISGTVHIPSAQNSTSSTGFTVKSGADAIDPFPFTLQITIDDTGLAAVGRTSAYYKQLVYSASAPTGSYCVASPNYKLASSNTNPEAKSYSYGEVV
jgi:hypothetical protein